MGWKKKSILYLILFLKNLCVVLAVNLIKQDFAKGVFAPKGFLYYPKRDPSHYRLHPDHQKAIIKNAKAMLTPSFFAGVKGMRKLAKIVSLENTKSNERYIKNFLTIS